MNILLMSSARSWGGVKTWMLGLAEFLAQRDHHVAIVCREGDLLVNECATRNIPCRPFRFGTDFSPLAIARFLKLFKAERTEIIITNISKEVRTAGIAAKLKGIYHINRLGAFGDLKMTGKTRFLYSYFIDKVFVSSQSLFDHFAKQDFLRSKLRMFHNAIKVPPLDIVQNPVLKFAVVAKLSEVKQIDKVLQAFSRIRDLSWELHIGGFGPELDALQQISRELSLDDHVYFTGEKIDPYEFLKDKDVGILYSRSEAFGVAIIEYMASSCAVIASNVGGIPEIIKHERDGLLVDPENLTELEQAIRVLLNDPQRRLRLLRQGYKTVRSRFTHDIIFPRIETELLKQ